METEDHCQYLSRILLSITLQEQTGLSVTPLNTEVILTYTGNYNIQAFICLEESNITGQVSIESEHLPSSIPPICAGVQLSAQISNQVEIMASTNKVSNFDRVGTTNSPDFQS